MTPTDSVSDASPTAPALTEVAAKAELQAYLDKWRTEGPVAAGRAYLAADQQASSEADAPRLKAGTITKVINVQPNPNGLTLQVTLNLAFQGDAGAWGNGPNDRFVTFTRRDNTIPYEMSFATGP